jgi:hypothetical protein
MAALPFMLISYHYGRRLRPPNAVFSARAEESGWVRASAVAGHGLRVPGGCDGGALHRPTARRRSEAVHGLGARKAPGPPQAATTLLAGGITARQRRRSSRWWKRGTGSWRPSRPKSPGFVTDDHARMRVRTPGALRFADSAGVAIDGTPGHLAWLPARPAANAGPSLAASSANTSEPPKSPGQGRWRSSRAAHAAFCASTRRTTTPTDRTWRSPVRHRVSPRHPKSSTSTPSAPENTAGPAVSSSRSCGRMLRPCRYRPTEDTKSHAAACSSQYSSAYTETHCTPTRAATAGR